MAMARIFKRTPCEPEPFESLKLMLGAMDPLEGEHADFDWIAIATQDKVVATHHVPLPLIGFSN